MEFDFERLKEQGFEFADRAKKNAKKLAGKGRDQMKLVELQAKLTKSQRQLGSLVYSLAKAGETNQPLVDQYIEAISDIEKDIEYLRSTMCLEAVPVVTEDEEYAVPVDKENGFNTTVSEEEPIEYTKKNNKICPQCGAKEPENSLFCSKCGAQL